MGPIDTHEIAWAAGLFDGEGCTLFHGAGHETQYATRRLTLTIAQRTENIYVLERFQKAVGRGKFEKHRKAQGNTKAQARYAVYSFEEVQYVIALLWKYLSPEKRKQAKHALSGYLKFNPNEINIKNGYIGNHRQVQLRKRIKQETEEEFTIDDFR